MQLRLEIAAPFAKAIEAEKTHSMGAQQNIYVGQSTEFLLRKTK